MERVAGHLKEIATTGPSRDQMRSAGVVLGLLQDIYELYVKFYDQMARRLEEQPLATDEMYAVAEAELAEIEAEFAESD
jgi:hypothetical protein